MNTITAAPKVALEIDGVLASHAETATIEEVVVTERLSMPAQCEITLFDPSGRLPIARRFRPGSEIGLTVDGSVDVLFTGDVTAVEESRRAPAERRVRVRAYDVLHRLRGRQPVRVHQQLTLADIARELVADLGLAVEAPGDLPVWPRLIQYRQSDFELLRALAARAGLHLAVSDGVLRLLTLEGYEDSIDLDLGETLHEAAVEINAVTSCRQISAFGWDPTRIVWHDVTAASARTGRDTRAGVEPADVGGSGERTLTNAMVTDPTHLSGAAQAMLDYGIASEVVFTGVAEGSAMLRPGRRVDVSGLGADRDGTYVITCARHTLDRRRGYVTELSSAPPPLAPPAGGVMVVPGVVTGIDDPDALGRVRVRLPTIAALETDWLCVVAMGAGAQKGLMALPDVDDQVLVLADADNPASGVVLGSVYGSRGIPDAGIEDGVVARYTLQTPGGQRLELDDHGTRVRVATSGGSFVEMKPDRVTLHAATDLLIEAPGRKIAIVADKVDFTRG